jgi:DNA-directed RNA polymerase subunit M/transcription elongation factor TFIIS
MMGMRMRPGGYFRLEKSVEVSKKVEVAVEKKIEMTQAIRKSVRNFVFNETLGLLWVVRGTKYEPQAICPKCQHEFKGYEVVQGFRRDPLDYDTTCPNCNHRFQPRVVFFENDQRVDLPFVCASQVLGQLRGKEDLAPAELSRQYPAVYRSAIIHWGSVSAAFQKIHTKYSFKEKIDWKGKIMPFLGRLPDTVIARVVEVSPTTIRRLRQKHDIVAFSAQRIAQKEKF